MGERSFYRFGAGALMVGAVLGLVANLMHPRASDATTSVRAELEMVSGSDSWTVIHIGLGIAVALASIGVVCVGRSMIRRNDSSWAWLMLFSLAISTALLEGLIALDTWTMKDAADTWAAAQGPSKDLAFASAQSIVNINFGLLIGAIGAHFGVTGVLLGAAVLDSDYPRNAGYLFLFAGAVGVLTSIMAAASGPSGLTLNVMFPLSSILFTLGGFWLGWLLWKRSEAPIAQPAMQGTLTS